MGFKLRLFFNVLFQRVGYTFKKDEIEDPIIHRIQSVFRRASIKWKDDVRLWLSFIAFCRKWASNIHLSKIFSSLLAFHSNKPGLWILGIFYSSVISLADHICSGSIYK